MKKTYKQIRMTLKTWKRLDKRRQRKEIGVGKESFELTINKLLDEVTP